MPGMRLVAGVQGSPGWQVCRARQGGRCHPVACRSGARRPHAGRPPQYPRAPGGRSRAGALPAELGRCSRMEAFSAFTNRLTAVPGALLAGFVECTRLSAALRPVQTARVRGGMFMQLLTRRSLVAVLR